MKKLFLFTSCTLIMCTNKTQAWEPAKGLEGVVVNCIMEYNCDTFLAGTNDKGLFVSFDKGYNWSQFGLQKTSVISLFRMGRSIIAGTYEKDLYVAASIDSSWTHDSIYSSVVYDIKLYHDTIFIATAKGLSGGVYFSVDTFKTWGLYNSNSVSACIDLDFSKDGRLFVATPNGAFYSDNKGPWTQTTGIGGTIWNSICIGQDSIIYSPAGFNLYLSTNNGISAFILNDISYVGNAGQSFLINDTLYVFTGDNIKYTNKLLTDWAAISIDKWVMYCTKINNQLYVGTTDGLYIENDSTTTNIQNIRQDHKNITIVPNPVKNIFCLNGVENDFLGIEIITLSGKVVYFSKSIVNNISDIKPGIYLVKITCGNKIYISRLEKI